MTDSADPKSPSLLTIVVQVALLNLHLLAALFCVFGFMASFEPGARQAMVFRMIYGVGFFSTLTIALVLAYRVFWPFSPKSLK